MSRQRSLQNGLQFEDSSQGTALPQCGQGTLGVAAMRVSAGITADSTPA